MGQMMEQKHWWRKLKKPFKEKVELTTEINPPQKVKDIFITKQHRPNMIRLIDIIVVGFIIIFFLLLVTTLDDYI